MLESLIETIDAGYHARRTWDFLVSFWEQERWFDTPHQRAAAELARTALEEAGLSDVRLAPYPADGKTRLQDWIMHMAWDCPSARLAYADSGEALADREKVQAATVYWCGPLASKDRPAVGEVVDGDALESITAKAVKGKFVLTAKPPAEMKRRVLHADPLAVVSDYLGEGIGYTEQTTKWCNTWSDAPGGWYYHANDKEMAGFCLSPAAGKKLRERLAEDPHLKLAGFCDARVYAGAGQNVTAVLEGEDPSREIWIYGHACEQGAHDNCSGVSILVESLRTLQELIVAGKLPRPRFSIRAITTEECIGMIAFATLQDDLRRRALAGLNVDAGGNPAPADLPYILNYGPLSNPSFGWAAAALVGLTVKQKAGDAWHLRFKRFVPNADDMISDPHCGIPAMWLGKGGNSVGYHSSSDTPEEAVSPDSLRFNTLLTAAWAYAMASMDDKLAGELIAPAVKWIDANVLGGEADAERLRRWSAAGVLRDLARWGVSESIYEPAAAEYSPAGAPPLPDLPTQGPRYVRTTWGTATLETLPADRREGFSRWSGWQTAALYWNDGRRPIAAVERLAKAEAGGMPETGLKPFYEACIEAGLMVEDNSGRFSEG